MSERKTQDSQTSLNEKFLETEANNGVVNDSPSKSQQDKTMTEAFHVPFWRMPGGLLFKEVFKFLITGLFFALNMSCNIITIFVNFVYIGYLKDPLILASFG